jgi:hypothetical protein
VPITNLKPVISSALGERINAKPQCMRLQSFYLLYRIFLPRKGFHFALGTCDTKINYLILRIIASFPNPSCNSQSRS